MKALLFRTLLIGVACLCVVGSGIAGEKGGGKAAGATDVKLQNKNDKPGNTIPGISYMARGGYRWEKDGKVLMDEEAGAKLVKEPPHWMMMWPFDSTTSKLPTRPNPSGVWIMFDGTPFAHLMVYQDLNKMKEK